MNIENDPGQQSESGNAGTEGSDAAANPNGQQGTDPAKPEGQGEGGDKTAATDGDKGDKGRESESTDVVELNGAPESYEQFTLPEGLVLEGDRLAMATEIAKELNLSQAGAQKLVDAYSKLALDDASGLVDKVAGSDDLLAPILERARQADGEKWAAELKAEQGDKFEAELAYCKTAVDALKSDKLKQEFDRLQWGNHPELFKAFAFFGRLVRDSPSDGIGREASTAQQGGSLSSRMYPSMNNNP